MQNCARALILGCGRSGRAAEALLRAEGAKTLMLDQETADVSDFPPQADPPEAGKSFSIGEQISNFEPQVAIVSPGFALDHPWIQKLQKSGIPLLSELELGWLRRKSRVIAVTGSNGKSTVVKWLADALSANGQNAVACGNYGFPVSAAVMQTPAPDWLVIEVSTFQLETVQEFRPDIGVLLNVLPNHLDRHGSMEAYRALKLKLFARQAEDDAAVVPVGFASDVPGAKTFGAGGDYQYVEGRVGAVNFSGTYFGNEVLGAAAAAGTAVSEACGLSAPALESSARAFEPLPHRMELVAEIDGVKFINDSKATNLAAMCAAERVSRLYLIGEASGMMQAAWGEAVDCTPCETVENAVSAVWGCTEPGDTVLLSPACASFDQFCDFNERGEVFAREVGKLKRKGC